MAGDYRLAKPPLIDTDIATSENFYTRTISGQPSRPTTAFTDFAGNAGIAPGHSGPPPAIDPATWTSRAATLGTTVAILRSMNPTLSANNPTDDLSGTGTWLDTATGPNPNGPDYVPGIYFFLPPGLAYPATTPAIPPPPVNFRHRYAIDAVGITSLALTPAGHGLDADNGLWALFATMDASYGGFPAMRLAFHQQSRSLQGYATRWEEVELLAHVAPDAQAFSAFVTGGLAAQRLGNYVYVFGVSSKVTVTTTGTDGFPTRLDADTHLIVQRIGPGRSISTRYNIDCSTTGEVGDLRSLIPIPNFGQSQHQFFVSDDATPFIWGACGDLSSRFNVIPGPSWEGVGSFGFADSGGADFGTFKSRQTTGSYEATGQLGAYLQVSNMPNNDVYVFGPTLVFPWRAGNYGAPELWYFVMHGSGKGAVYDIYAAKWARNQYQRIDNVTITDDTSFQAGHRRFPTRNPDGYAFDSNWYQSQNKIGRVGPFVNADVWNQQEQESPDSDQIRWPGFRVLRDANRIGQMQFVMANTGPLIGAVG